MSIIGSISQHFGTMGTWAIVAASGAMVGEALHRPPIYSGLFIGTSYLFKKCAKNAINNNESIVSKPKLVPKLLDIILPYGYLQISNSSCLWPFFKKHHINFCISGTLAAYFIGLKTSKVVEPMLCSKATQNKKQKTEASWFSDIAHVLTTIISSSFIKTKRRGSYIAVMVTVALIERLSIRIVDYLNLNHSIKKIVKNSIGLFVPVSILLETSISHTWFPIKKYKYVNAHLINSLIWGIFKTWDPLNK